MDVLIAQSFQMNQIITVKDVMKFTSISRSKIYELINKESKYYDPTFPQPIRLSESRIGWSALEIHQWIESKLKCR
ncbi:helix-turn-helix transcriptional regulator [Acinetobacter higginsii]|uniref:helix-turn-helix transcriptional regulator n=1 Tax=Acinetobacter higginsii TaxID=70347 RepID=UPI001F6205BA|nr:AlpA family phage regulatory protein [Acinetobacter higginsii]MCI3878632.1 AlpA family phage regulatory protein [Acinetobacter higginsii]